MKLRFVKCSISECNGNAHAGKNGRVGMCSKHYVRFRKHGDASFEWKPNKPAQDWLDIHISHSNEKCLKWPFYIASDGYGRAHHPVTGILITASRVMCILAHGEPETSSMHAAHSCGKGNEACVNPKHLYWATHTQNQKDRIEHGTTNRGDRQWKAKLNSEDVLKIRRLLNTETQASIARIFAVNASTISDIATRKRWNWLI